MASPFDDIDGAVQAAMTRVFGEAIRVVPQTAGDYTAGADGSRPAKAIRATVNVAPTAANTDFANTGRRGVPAMISHAELWLDSATYAGLGYAVRRGDLIELTDRGTPAPRVTVTAIEPGDHADIIIKFAAGGGP